MAEALIVDDEPNTLEALAELVQQTGFEVRTAASLADARGELQLRLPDVILCDLVLPDGSGSELLDAADADPDIQIIMITANATVSSAIEALRRGAYDYLTKPVDIDRLKALLRRLLREAELRQEVRRLRRRLSHHGRFGGMVGSSAAMHEVYQLAERVASTDATVLVSGESGTGKELVAESIHRLSHRSSGPFVPINCGAVASELIESELFGHERGSFTGAERRHRGVFERAHMGTLLLDEITEMSAQLQVKLLRALETSSIRRVGGDAEIDVDVRVIAATNRDAGEAVADGRLREDLYYRLKVFPITLPPLRDRVGDIPLLVRHFLDQLGREELEIEPPALERLERFHWPGNVRELRNVVERCSILADDVITEATLPPEIRSGEAGMPRLQAPIGTSLDEIVREHTLATLEHFGGDKPRAAETLGISLKTLYNRLNRYLDE
jgi:DNA-binding NtrC family response regulator